MGATGSLKGMVVSSKCENVLSFPQTHSQSVVFVDPQEHCEVGKDVVISPFIDGETEAREK